MSLNFDVSTIRNYEVLTTLVIPAHGSQKEQTRWHPVTDALIWGTMAIGMNTITIANWQDFYNRLNMWERCAGPSLWRGDNGRNDPANFITPLEVYMHIGLHTNASTKTEAQFLKDCFRTAKDSNSSAIKKAPEAYCDLDLDTITKDEWQQAWRISPEAKPYTTDTLVRKVREPDTPIGPLGPTENIGSTT
jgi:hypothetical protein